MVIKDATIALQLEVQKLSEIEILELLRRNSQSPAQILQHVEIPTSQCDILRQALPEGYSITKSAIKNTRGNPYSFSLMSKDKIHRHLIFLPQRIIEDTSAACEMAFKGLGYLFYEVLGNIAIYVIHEVDLDSFWKVQASKWKPFLKTQFTSLSEVEGLAALSKEDRNIFVIDTFNLKIEEEMELSYKDISPKDFGKFIDVLSELQEFQEDYQTYINMRAGLVRLGLPINWDGSHATVAARVIDALRKLDSMPGYDSHHPFGFLFEQIIALPSVSQRNKREIREILTKYNLVPEE